jgi:hypothetical protein
MVSDLEKVTDHVIRIVFQHCIVRVHVVINSRLVGAWILGILARETSFERRVCRDGEVSSRTLSFLVLS